MLPNTHTEKFYDEDLFILQDKLSESFRLQIVLIIENMQSKNSKVLISI